MVFYFCCSGRSYIFLSGCWNSNSISQVRTFSQVNRLLLDYLLYLYHLYTSYAKPYSLSLLLNLFLTSFLYCNMILITIELKYCPSCSCGFSFPWESGIRSGVVLVCSRALSPCFHHTGEGHQNIQGQLPIENLFVSNHYSHYSPPPKLTKTQVVMIILKHHNLESESSYLQGHFISWPCIFSPCTSQLLVNCVCISHSFRAFNYCIQLTQSQADPHSAEDGHLPLLICFPWVSNFFFFRKNFQGHSPKNI